MALANFDTIINRIIIELNGSPNPLLVKEELIGAMQEFCTRSWAWNIDCPPQSIVANQSVYPILLGELKAVRPVKILKLAINQTPIKPIPIDTAEKEMGVPIEDTHFTGNPKFFTQKNHKQVVLMPKPDSNQIDAITMRIVVAPTFDATQVDEVLTETWRDAVIHGAFARLHAMHGKPWSVGDMSSYHQSLFNAAIDQARDEVQKGLVRSSFKTKVRFL